jgi:hypothetical protein
MPKTESSHLSQTVSATLSSALCQLILAVSFILRRLATFQFSVLNRTLAFETYGQSVFIIYPPAISTHSRYLLLGLPEDFLCFLQMSSFSQELRAV